MARLPRLGAGDVVYHVLTRGNNRAQVFTAEPEYRDFVGLIASASRRVPMRILAYCLMPNHIHLVLWPRGDDDLRRFMHWLLSTHAHRHHRGRGTSGHVWQGRFKTFPVQSDEHLLTVLRYVERNPVRAGLVTSPEQWPWSSAGPRCGSAGPVVLAEPPIELPAPWLEWIRTPLTEPELSATRRHLLRGRPFGDPGWAVMIAGRLGLLSTLAPRGRPPGNPKKVTDPI